MLSVSQVNDKYLEEGENLESYAFIDQQFQQHMNTFKSKRKEEITHRPNNIFNLQLNKELPSFSYCF